MRSNTRARIARSVSRLPGQCGADATAWAVGISTCRWPWFPQTPGCRADLADHGECLCGRLRDLGDGYVQAERGDLEEMLRRGEDRG